MKNLRYGATINPNGSLRKIHILEDFGRKISCKKMHLHKLFNATYVYSYDEIPRDVYFCRGCAKKSKFKRSIMNNFQFKIPQKKRKITSEDIMTDSSDDEYVPVKQKRRLYKKKITVIKPVQKLTEPIKLPKKMSSGGFVSIFGKSCYYYNKIPTDGICIFESHIFHTYKYNCIFNYEKLNRQKFENPEDGKIYKYPKSKNLTFMEWADDFSLV